MSTRIRTTHEGSLVLPPQLVTHLTAILAGSSYNGEEFDRELTQSVKDVVERQAAIGIDILNDGEFGKTHWYRYAIDRFSGIGLP